LLLAYGCDHPGPGLSGSFGLSGHCSLELPGQADVANFHSLHLSPKKDKILKNIELIEVILRASEEIWSLRPWELWHLVVKTDRNDKIEFKQQRDAYGGKG
jgi:hypothetical protein